MDAKGKGAGMDSRPLSCRGLRSVPGIVPSVLHESKHNSDRTYPQCYGKAGSGAACNSKVGSTGHAAPK